MPRILNRDLPGLEGLAGLRMLSLQPHLAAQSFHVEVDAFAKNLALLHRKNNRQREGGTGRAVGGIPKSGPVCVPTSTDSSATPSSPMNCPCSSNVTSGMASNSPR